MEKNQYLLDKNLSYSTNSNNGIAFEQQLNMKLEERLHLPSLVNSNNGTKNGKGKYYQKISSLNNESNYDPNYLEITPEVMEIEKLTPITMGQKIIKIPIEKLKPLKPEEIKLKYQKKIKEEQRNRAKDIAMHIFNREEEEQRIRESN